jgi:hypothetical protein
MVQLVPYSAADPAKIEAIRAFVVKTDPTLPSNMWLYRCTIDSWPQLCFMVCEASVVFLVFVCVCADCWHAHRQWTEKQSSGL